MSTSPHPPCVHDQYGPDAAAMPLAAGQGARPASAASADHLTLGSTPVEWLRRCMTEHSLEHRPALGFGQGVSRG